MNIKLVVFDFDGVFTNSKVSFNNNDIIKEYNVKDGIAISKLHKNNFNLGVISGSINHLCNSYYLKD
jgi:3-deoxy-D-manno-octulosonate 8-phosphate phosphatase KdsC-like HAD superfamily phosphatase